MKEKNQILLAVDGSEPSLCAVAYAAAMIPKENAEFVLFHVRPRLPEMIFDVEQTPSPGSEELPLDHWQADQAGFVDAFMAKAKAALTRAGVASAAVSEKIRETNLDAARDILSESRRGYAALVVGRTGFSRPGPGFKGSVADKLIEQMAHLPLVVVGGDPETEKIMVAFDRSSGTEHCVACLGRLVDPGGREVVLCSVIRPLSAYGTGAEFLPTAGSRTWIDKSTQKVIPPMKKARDALAAAGFSRDRIFRQIVTDNVSRAEGVLHSAAKRGCGTIFVGRRGLTIEDEFMMGRVCRKIVARAEAAAVWIVN